MRYLILLILAACAATPTYHWERPGATAEAASIEAAQCQSQAFAVPFSTEERIAIVYATCMQGRGWRLVEE